MADRFHNTYGLDIEIDPNGIVDPAHTGIRRVAISTPRDDLVFDGPEAEMLEALDAHLDDLAPGVIATWNGSMFDLPFLADRARLLGVRLGLTLVADPCDSFRRRPLPGHAGTHRARWRAHRHLDTYRLDGDGGSAGSWTMLLGLVRRRGTVANTSDLLNEALHAHAASDARLARVLAERRGPAALRAADRIEAHELPGAVPVPVSGRRERRTPPTLVHPDLRVSV